MNKRLLAIVTVVPLLTLALWWFTGDEGSDRFTGFVEGEERIVRSEVAGRVLEVSFREGDPVPADAIVARLDARDIDSRLESKRRELDVLDADVRTQQERVRLTETTWERDVAARRAEVDQAVSAADNAERSFVRERDLTKSGASTAQFLDDAQARRDQARSALERARELAARTAAEEANIAVARQTLEGLGERRGLILAHIAELDVTRSKYAIRAPAIPTELQTQYIWPGELAQAGAPVVSVLDPKDKYVQVYVPVHELDRFRIGAKVEIEMDSTPGERVPGEISFVADRASFTPEKIETRDDRVGQVYRAKVRILENPERLQPGAECDVYLAEPLGDSAEAGARR